VTPVRVEQHDFPMDATSIETAVAAVGGNRLRWHEVADVVRDALASALGAPVVSANSRPGGFSPGLASVLTLADGRTVFAKAISVSRNDFTVAAIRRERDVLAALPAHVPASRLRWSYDDGDWVAIVTDAIDGHNPVQPWRRDELGRFLAAASVLAEALTPSPLTPCPLAASAPGPAGGAVTAASICDEEEFRSWAAMAADPGAIVRLAPWIQPRVHDLAELDARWPAATSGESLMHGDFRADNVVLTPDGGFVAVDWPSVLVGPPWLDLLCALPSVAMHGGGDPEALWSGHPFGRAVDADMVNVALAGFAGLVLSRSLQPAPPLIPTIREFQRAQGEITLRWLYDRLGWG
jgi:hypothetical protein